MSRVLTPADAASSGCPLYDETKVGFGLSSPLPSAKGYTPEAVGAPRDWDFSCRFASQLCADCQVF